MSILRRTGSGRPRRRRPWRDSQAEDIGGDQPVPDDHPVAIDDRRTDAEIRFGDALRRALDEAGMTAAEMAERLFVTERSVRRYTSADRRPDASIVAQWERICELAPGELIEPYAALPAKGVVGAQPVSVTPSARSAASGERAAIVALFVLTLLVGLGGYVSGRDAMFGDASVARGLRSSSGTPTPEARRSAGAFARAVRSLSAARVRARRSLVAARTPAAQVAGARRLRSAYARAARRLRVPADAFAAGPRVLAAVRAAQHAYATLVAAARDGRRLAFRHASARVRRAERRLRVALPDLRHRRS